MQNQGFKNVKVVYIKTMIGFKLVPAHLCGAEIEEYLNKEESPFPDIFESIIQRNLT